MVSEAKALVAWYAVEEEGYSTVDTARYLGMSHVGVLAAIKRHKMLNISISDKD